MSQHFWQPLQRKEKVQAGWDRCLQLFFLTIFRDENEDDVVFDSLGVAADWMSLNSLRSAMRAHGLDLPDQIASQLLNHKANPIGNAITHHYLTTATWETTRF